MSYYEFRQQAAECSSCRWEGFGREASIRLEASDVIEHACPGCARVLRRTAVPGSSETEQHLHELTTQERNFFEASERAHQRYLQAVLKDANQLPDLEGDELEFVWDQMEDGGEYSIVLKHGSQELWREPAYFECYRRFGEILELLISRYGARVKDVAPTTRSLLYLYGESFVGPEIVCEVRERLYGAHEQHPAPVSAHC
ncbi:MAG: hypothetical protein WBV82_06800 [Myxococcaceae bacterium]